MRIEWKMNPRAAALRRSAGFYTRGRRRGFPIDHPAPILYNIDKTGGKGRGVRCGSEKGLPVRTGRKEESEAMTVHFTGYRKRQE